jgi:hypothetical protein
MVYDRMSYRRNKRTDVAARQRRQAMRRFGNSMSGRPTRWRSSNYRRHVFWLDSESNERPASRDFIESFSKFSSGVQNLAVVIGLIVGALWALQTFAFQNPVFREKGSEIAGFEPEVVRSVLTLVPLNQVLRQYEVTLTVSNASKTLSQIVHPNLVDITFFKPGEKETYAARFISRPISKSGIYVPVGESRDFRYLVEFPSDGSYILETNICQDWGHNCLTQKMVYVSAQRIGSATPSMPAF